MAQELISTSLYSDANLRAYYRFNTGALTTDSGANGYTLTNDNTVADGTGKFGGAADYGASNTDKRLYINNNLGMTGSKSISLWVKLNTEIGSSEYTFFNTYDTTTGRVIRLGYQYNGGTRRLAFFSDKADIAEVVGYYTITMGTSNWYHLVLTYNHSTGNVLGYVNGVQQATVTSSGDGSTGYTNLFCVGAVKNISNTLTYFPSSAIIDDVATFSDVLTATEISNIYNIGIKKIAGVYRGSQEIASTALASDANLVQYTRFEGNSTATVGGNGTDTNISYGTSYGKFGQGALLNGTDSKISIPKLATQSAGAISFWINPGRVTSAGQAIINNRLVASASGYMWQMATSDGAISLLVRDGGNTTWTINMTSSTLLLGANKWSHIVWTWGASGHNIYLNASSIVSTATTNSVFDNTNPIFIGLLSNDTEPLQGSIDDVAIFSRALTASEISNIYNTGIKRISTVTSYAPPELAVNTLSSDANLVSYWRMEGNSNDSKGSNNGTDTAVTYSTANGRFNQGAGMTAGGGISLGSPTSLDFGNNGAFTWTGWVKPTTLVDNMGFVGKTPSDNVGYSYLLALLANGGTEVYNGSSWINIAPASSVVTGSWQMITYAYDGTNMRCYVNGVQKGSDTAFSYTDTATHNIYIGKWFQPLTIYDYDGAMDDLSIFSRALTASEISNIYNTNIKKVAGVSNI